MKNSISPKYLPKALRPKRGKNLLIIISVWAFLIVLVWILFKTADLNDSVRQKSGNQFIQLSEGMVRYQLVGNSTAPLIVLVSGFPLPMEVWEKTVTGLVDRGFQVLRFDLYGMGLSARPTGPYTIKRFSSELKELLDRLNLGSSFQLVGHSMGALIATQFAIENPDRVERLVLVDPQRKAQDFPAIKNELLKPVLELIIPSLIPGFAQGYFYRSTDFEVLKKALVEQTKYAGIGTSSLEILKSIHSNDFTDLYRSLAEKQRNVVLIWGAFDWVVPYVSESAELESIFHTKAIEIPFSSHIPQWENSTAFLSALTEKINTSETVR